VPVALRFVGPLDTGALAAAWAAIVDRHEVLRTRFVAQDGVAGQVVAAPAGADLPLVDVSGEAQPHGRTRDLVAEDVAAPFDLAAAPAWRARLIRTGPTDHVLSLVLHHVICDEWSVEVLRSELAERYAAFRSGDAAPLPPLTVQYRDFAAWQRDWLQGDVLDGQLAWWQERLAALPPLDLPTDRPRPAVLTTAGATHHFTVDPGIVDGLRAVARRSGATMFMTLLAAFDVVLGRWADQDDVAVGTPIANRTRAEVEGLIGFFVNTLVIRTDLSGDPTFDEVVRRVRAAVLGAHAHQDVPFEQLVEMLQPDRDRSRTPLFQVIFNYDQGGGERAPGLSELTTSTYAGSPLAAIFDLRLALAEEHDGGLGGTVEYRTDLFDAATVARLVEQLLVLLTAVAS
jgi:hypothetical protein